MELTCFPRLRIIALRFLGCHSLFVFVIVRYVYTAAFYHGVPLLFCLCMPRVKVIVLAMGRLSPSSHRVHVGKDGALDTILYVNMGRI